MNPGRMTLQQMTLAAYCSATLWLAWTRLDRRLAPARGHLPPGSCRHVEGAAAPAARHPVRHGQRVQLGRAALPYRGPGEALGAHDARYGHERSALIYTHTSARHVPFHAVAIPPRARRPDEKLIAAHWADVLRVTCSVRTGVVSPSLMLKRLSAYPRQNRLALALREVERIERTLRTLDWIEQPEQRAPRQPRRNSTRARAEHALARAVCLPPARPAGPADATARPPCAEPSGQRAGTLVDGGHRPCGTRPILAGRPDAMRANAVAGRSRPRSAGQHLAPLRWQHINLTGDYLWGADEDVGPDGFRLLRNMAAPPWATAA